MATLVFGALLLFAMVSHSSGSWCVCKQGQNNPVLQKTLDYACGAGADCNPLHSNGPCHNPDNLLAHCNYAVNSFFQKKGQAPGTCDFSGAATVVTSDPSTAGCSYPTSASASGSTTPATSTNPASPTTGTINPTTPSGTTSPYVTTNSSTGGVLGGGGGGMGTGGLGPSGVGNNNDESDGGIIRLRKSTILPPFLTGIMCSGFVLLWG